MTAYSSNSTTANDVGHRSIAAMLWPTGGTTLASALRAVVLVAFGTALLAASAKINVPLPYVPMTMQTLVVMLIAMIYGSKLGTATLVAYLAEGALGLPVFAGATAGPLYMMGPTGGFLAGFVVAAAVVGWLAERGFDRSMIRVFTAMTIGHIVILGFGFAWLAFGLHLGIDKAWAVGVLPFIAGSLVKNALGAVIVPNARRSVAK